jgi:hypothetical protein
MMIPPWNLTKHAAEMHGADVIVISPAKAGRTWLRVMINQYFSLRYGIPFSLRDLHDQNASIPSIIYEHWLWYQLRVPKPIERLNGRYVIPSSVLARKKLVILVRDPRDIIVSAYFQETRREHKSRRTDMTLKEFIRDKRRGMSSLIKVLNLTYARIRNRQNHILLKYESIAADPITALSRVLEFGGVTPIPELVAQAVSFASFDNMKRIEAADELKNEILRPGNFSDPESFKVRRGKIGGYTDYLDQADQDYINANLARLDPYFGYPVGETSYQP